MGDKVRAKAAMAAAGVPVVPGHGRRGDRRRRARCADELGYPCCSRRRPEAAARACGSSARRAELEETFETASVEALAAFGDGRIYVEKALVPARHVEVQVLADGDGNVLTLGERECSIQRRHQKLVEESPSPALDARAARGDGGRSRASVPAVGYLNAGTFEFLVGPDGAFYFIELNARLQVEHPVTELVTGLDLVRGAAPHRRRRAVVARPGAPPRGGHAIEVRLNAEDPPRTSLPHRAASRASGRRSGRSTGWTRTSRRGPRSRRTMTRCSQSSSSGTTTATPRSRAAAGRSAELEIEGVRTTRELAIDIMHSEAFMSGRYSTSFLDEAGELPALTRR